MPVPAQVKHNTLGYIGELYSPFRCCSREFVIRPPTQDDDLKGPVAPSVAQMGQADWYVINGTICQPGFLCFFPCGDCAKVRYRSRRRQTHACTRAAPPAPTSALPPAPLFPLTLRARRSRSRSTRPTTTSAPSRWATWRACGRAASRRWRPTRTSACAARRGAAAGGMKVVRTAGGAGCCCLRAHPSLLSALPHGPSCYPPSTFYRAQLRHRVPAGGQPHPEGGHPQVRPPVARPSARAALPSVASRPPTATARAHLTSATPPRCPSPFHTTPCSAAPFIDFVLFETSGKRNDNNNASAGGDILGSIIGAALR